MTTLPHIALDPADTRAPYRDAAPTHATRSALPPPSAVKVRLAIVASARRLTGGAAGAPAR
jgi:hypothetical protein